MKRLFFSASLVASLFAAATANASHQTFFGAIDAIDHTFASGGGVFAATPSGASDDAWLLFASNAGDNLVIDGAGIFGPNMVLFREVTNGVVEIGDLAGVTNFNINQTGSGTDLVVQHPGFRGAGTDQYVVPGTINFTTTVAGQYVIGLSPANESSGFVGTTTVTLSGNTADIFTFTPVDLDIKPGSDPNSINLGSRGVLPVALLTADDFDALDVDVATVLFGDPNGNSIAPLRSGEEDVNGDGLIDLTLKFSMRELVDNGALGGMSVEGILIGLLLDGTPFEASDSIRLVPPGDGNNDQIVNAADYTIWADNFGTNGNGTPGDFDEDNHVDGADYTMWANNFGTDLSAPSIAAAAVPEPSTFVLSALGLIGLVAYGRRRRRRA